MINFISSWINSIVLIIFFVFIIEIFIPRNNMKKYVKVVLGILIMLGIIMPIIDFLNIDFEINTDFIEKEINKDINTILIKGKELKTLSNSLAVESLKEELKKDIKRRIKLIKGYNNVNINVEIIDDMDNSDFGEIVRLDVFIANKNEVIKTVKPIEINLKDEKGSIKNKENIEDDKNIELKIMLSQYYDINLDNIFIKFVEKGEG